MRKTSAKHSGARAQTGFSLIELMIAILLGFLVVGAAGALFMSNKRTYSTTETLGRIQEGARVSFELMSRDIREAGGNPCSTGARLVNQLEDGNDSWWAGYSDGLRGYGPSDAMSDSTLGNAAGNRRTGTDAIELHNTTAGNIRVTEHDNPSAVAQVSSSTGIAVDDILMICNMSYAMIFQVTQLPSGDVQHNGATGGNCNNRFIIERAPDGTCPSGTVEGYCFMADPTAPSVDSTCKAGHSNTPAFIAHPLSVRWFVRVNEDGTNSLVRQTVRNRTSDGAVGDVQTDEIAQGIENLEFQYLLAGGTDFVQEGAVSDWKQVISVRAVVTAQGTGSTLQGQNIQGTDGKNLERRTVNIIALRNREGSL
ncbi:prepilin-type N-terminal cleavage/methylation domain-containing protein [Arenimonas sp.]|uniref:prepilin-type N-terminal cleavage/methylation domain-containing protein n=1 Tax=Arenimonas sp. TaxID=1872635 RepID=UPI0035B23EE4